MIETKPRAILFRVGGLGDLLVALPSIALVRRWLPSRRLALVGRAEYASLLVRAGIVDEAIAFDDPRMTAIFGPQRFPGGQERKTETTGITISPDLGPEGPRRSEIGGLTGVSLAMGWWNSNVDWPGNDWWAGQGIGWTSFVIYDRSSGLPISRFFFDRTLSLLHAAAPSAASAFVRTDRADNGAKGTGGNLRAGDRGPAERDGAVLNRCADGEDPLFDDCARLKLPAAAIERALGSLGLRPLGPGETRLVVHPGSGGRSKRWPLANFLEVVRHSASRGIPGVVVTGEAEEDLEPPLRAIALPAGWLRFSRLPTETLAGLLASSTHYIGNDSGPTHLAAACGARTLAFFLDANLQAWTPFGRTQVISAPDVDRIPLASAISLLGDFLAP